MAELTPEVMRALARLLKAGEDLSGLTDEEIHRGMVGIRTGAAELGRYAAELRARGWSWPRIAEGLDVDQSTAYRWVHPRTRRKPQEDEQ